MDLLRDLLKISEADNDVDFATEKNWRERYGMYPDENKGMPDFHSMSDEQLMHICAELEMEDLCVLDDDGRITNREELIRDLEQGHGEVDMEDDLGTPPTNIQRNLPFPGKMDQQEPDFDKEAALRSNLKAPREPQRDLPFECTVMSNGKKVKTFDTMTQAEEYLKSHKGEKLTIKEMAMPAGVIKQKQKIANMSEEDRKAYFGYMTKDKAARMERRLCVKPGSYTKYVSEEKLTEGKKTKFSTYTNVRSSFNFYKPVKTKHMVKEARTIYAGGEIVRDKKGKEIGEVYPVEGYPGEWGYFHYDADFGADMIDKKEHAHQGLMDMHQERIANRRRRSTEDEEQLSLNLGKGHGKSVVSHKFHSSHPTFSDRANAHGREHMVFQTTDKAAGTAHALKHKGAQIHSVSRSSVKRGGPFDTKEITSRDSWFTAERGVKEAETVKFKQPANPKKKPALPAYGGLQKDMKNKTAAQSIEDEIGDAGLKGMTKKDRPFNSKERPSFKDWLTGNMVFDMTPSGELAGSMKLGENFEHIKTKIADFVVRDLGREYVDVAQRIDYSQSYGALVKILDDEEMSLVYAAKSLTPAEQDELQAGVDQALAGSTKLGEASKDFKRAEGAFEKVAAAKKKTDKKQQDVRLKDIKKDIEKSKKDVKEGEQLNELKVPSKLKRLGYSLAHETQPEDVIRRVKSMDDREVASLHRGYEKEGDVPGRHHGSPAHVQKRALAREYKKRHIAFPTLNTEAAKPLRLRDILGEKWKEEAKIPEAQKGKHTNVSLKDLHSQLAAAKKAGNTGLIKELDFAIRAKTGWGKVNK